MLTWLGDATMRGAVADGDDVLGPTLRPYHMRRSCVPVRNNVVSDGRASILCKHYTNDIKYQPDNKPDTGIIFTLESDVISWINHLTKILPPRDEPIELTVHTIRTLLHNSQLPKINSTNIILDIRLSTQHITPQEKITRSIIEPRKYIEP